MVDLIRQNTSLPCAVGFGIATPQQAAAMAKVSDGAIVGSAIIKLFAQYGPAAVPLSLIHISLQGKRSVPPQGCWTR